MISQEGDYVAVIFSSTLRGQDPEYEMMAERMVALARQQPGFLGLESYREGAQGVTVSYFKTVEDVKAWRAHPEHIEAQNKGRSDWYERYRLRVAVVVRDYEFVRSL